MWTPVPHFETVSKPPARDPAVPYGSIEERRGRPHERHTETSRSLRRLPRRTAKTSTPWRRLPPRLSTRSNAWKISPRPTSNGLTIWSRG